MTAREILKDLIAFNTIEDKENHEIMAYIEDYLKPLGFTVEKMANKDNGKLVLIASYGDDPALGFLGHTDTVDIGEGWVTDPHVLTEKDGDLYGRGTCDMKGGIAAFLAAIGETDLAKLKKGIKVYCTYDEEIMFGGVKDLVEAGTVFPPHVVVAEPTDLVPQPGSKGLLEYIFTFEGESTHSSLPIEGKNSNKNAVRFLNRMLDFEEELKKETDDFFGVPYSTMNIGIIEGGTAINIVPAKTTVYLDFRINDSAKQYDRIRAAVDEALEGLNGSYDIINDIASFQNAGPLVSFYEEQTGKKAEPFFGITEASFFEGDKMIIGVGPVVAHEPNERVNIKSLEDTTELFRKVIEKVCM